MSLLQFLVTVASVFFAIFALDLYQRKKITILHVLVFGLGSILLIRFSLDQNALNAFGRFFGVARGADILVYIALIVLAYFYFEILNNLTRQKFHFSRLVSSQALEKLEDYDYSHIPEPSIFHDQFVFLVRAYNEANVIGATIDEIINAGFSKIVIVNDGSKDNTKQIVKEKISQYPNKTIILISHLINRGGGAANKTGFAFLKANMQNLKVNRAVGFDADGQMDIHDMKNFMSYIKQGISKEITLYDIYLGSRFISGGTATNMPFMRKCILWGSKIITYIFNHLRITDPHSGYKVYSQKTVKSVELSSDGMTYANELIDEIRKKKLSYKELPINIRYTEYSLGKGQKNSNAIKILIELIYKKLFFK